MDYINIGPNPCDEDCVQIGSDDYNRKARIECAAFREAIRKKLGEEPMGAQLTIKSFPHDFGSYMEVVCVYDEKNEEAAQYAFKCEGEAPATWAEVGMENPHGDQIRRSERSGNETGQAERATVVGAGEDREACAPSLS